MNTLKSKGHTATPWEYQEKMGKDTRGQVLSKEGFICACPDHKDAAFIVTAVNEYESNQEAIKSLHGDVDKVCEINRELVEALNKIAYGVSFTNGERITIAQQALAKAGA